MKQTVFAGRATELALLDSLWSSLADNWVAEGMRLLDLKQIDEDLVHWEERSI